jgi:3-hydroxy acid dehydrogenase/malonic semialdehyde reductase
MDKYALITGATSGIGEACALQFSKLGYSLILLARREDRLLTLKNELEKDGVNVLTFSVDVRNESQVANAINSLSSAVKSNLKVLINNAGLAVGRGVISEGVIDDWERMIDTNIKGLLYVSRYVAPIMQSNKQGHIFNVSSIAGKEVYAGGNVYCATKHAVDALSKAMRIDLVQDNIKVTNIAPGATETEFSIVRFKGDAEQAKAVYTGFEALMADDIAEVIVFAASRPAHVNLNDITIMPTAQASATVIHKSLP